MNKPSSFLVGLDFDGERGLLTEGSKTAARHAFWMAGICDARVDFFHSTYRSDETQHSDFRGASDAGRSELSALRDEFDVESTDLILSDERPSLGMTRRVLSGANDIVVAAKRNQSRRQDRKLGSVSIQLVRMCPCPVWVVKSGQELEHRSVLAATDLSVVGDLATEYGALIAAAEDCDLFVVHAWQVPLDLQMSHSRIGDEEFLRGKRSIAEAARRHIEAIPSLAELGERVKIQLAADSPSHIIQEVVRKESPDLAVLGTVSRGGIAGLLVGNTAEKLLTELDCSLLTVKPVDFICPVH